MSSCSHLSKYKSQTGLCTFRLVHAFYVTCVTKNSCQRKARECFCHICHIRKRIHVCLSCIFFGCFSGLHIHKHATENQHPLAIDSILGHVFCFECNDYVYDQEFEVITRKHKSQLAKHLGTEICDTWQPPPIEITVLKEAYESKQVVDGSFLGLRGIINLGNTCFMSCIIQTLIHTPLLRDYFLSDKHVCNFKEKPSMCLACEMTKLFQEFFSGTVSPYIPYQLLYLVWMHAEHLSGYFQQDAHEFFIATLNILHLHCKGSNVLHDKNDRICNCIIDQIFTGFLQSELVCLKCKSVSTTVDPFWDISLDLGSNSNLFSHNSGRNNAAVSSSEPTSLYDCLERFTQPEHLGSENRTCENCQSYQDSTKQLTLKKLPLVISFNFKRSSRQGKNIRFISFPECLDMTPFISAYRSRSTGNTDPVISSLNDSDHKFHLFAVVSHIGDTQGGHYYSFVRQYKSIWFKCDDHLITKANTQDVLKSEAYLLFYHKQMLEYDVYQGDIG